jgi:signal transduction histidine kinase/ligand-binding sensor domain-containing protein/DNA-binding response OmpR family regulator
MSKNTFFSIIVFTVFIFANKYSVCETLKFEHFSNKEGFSQNTINDIIEDEYGFLWFGTPNGLIKYDGYDFFNYTHDPLNENSISNNFIRSLYKDAEGNLWIGTRSGINVYLPQLEKFIKVPLYSNLQVQQISADPEGRIWILGKNVLFTCKLKDSEGDYSFEVSDNVLKTETNSAEFPKICFVGNNRILSFRDFGLYSIQFESDSLGRNVNLKSVHDFHKLADAEVNTIYNVDNIFWIGTNSGLYKIILDGERIRIMEKCELTTWDNRIVHDQGILSIFEDKVGNVWIGSTDNGIFKYNSKTDSFENYGYNPKDKNGISSERINCFFQDRFGVIWIGTAQGGINKLDVRQKQFISYTNNPYDDTSISGNLINSILEDSKGFLWVASYNAMVCRSTTPVNDDNIGQLRFEHFQNQSTNVKEDIVLNIFEDERGFVWFGAKNTVSVFNPVNKKIKTIKFEYDGIVRSNIFCPVIEQLDSNTMVFAGKKIVLVKNPWEAILKQKEPLLKANTIFDDVRNIQVLVKDRKNNFWFGTRDGLFILKYENGEFKAIQGYSVDENAGIKLSHKNIFSIHEDNTGNIWLGTFGGGLNKIIVNDEGFPVEVEYFSKSGILPDDAVYGILQEDDDHIWISTDMGLCRMQISENKADLFDVRDGLVNDNFRRGAYHKGKSGNFYFGGLNGLTVFKPENIKLNEVLSNPVITGISINNNRIKVGELLNGKVLLDKSVFETDKITINHQVKILSFHIAAQQSTAPLKNKIAYMLEGFDNEWIETKNGKTSITFTNLRAGDYVLRLKSANGDGLWNPETRNLRIRVLPPWYKTAWSIVLFIFLAIAIVVGVLVYFINYVKLKQSLIYEQIDKKRIDQANQRKLRFFTNISHEFRTPLTLISGPLEYLINRNSNKEDTKYLTTIQNNTKRLLSLVDQLITFRQAEQGHLNLNLSTVTLGDFIYPSTEAFEDFAIQKNVNFFYKINSPEEEVVIDVEKTERIIFNLLSNSFRHTPVHGNISIETDIKWLDTKKMISIKVIDTGKGIPPEKQAKIFERFYQVEGRKENVGGTGIGLAFSKSLIDLMGGTISVESEPDVRTCFSLLMPSQETQNKHEAKAESSTQSFIKEWVPVQVLNGDEISKTASGEEKLYSLVVVEDEADVRDFLMNSLGKKYSIILAENGVDGLNKIKQNKPDLIISDVMMPEMNGFVLCEKVKSDPETCHIPVILLTALGGKENQLKGLEFSADDYINKPFSPMYLEKRVEQLIENNQRLKAYFSKNSTIPDKTIQMASRDTIFLKEVIQAIESNLSDSNFGVEELAAEIRLSPSQLYRRLKQLTGQIPNVYLRNYRLQRAAELFKSNEGLNVAEVMYKIGIESSSYFSTSFKKLHGISPSEFTKKQNL